MAWHGCESLPLTCQQAVVGDGDEGVHGVPKVGQSEAGLHHGDDRCGVAWRSTAWGFRVQGGEKGSASWHRSTGRGEGRHIAGGRRAGKADSGARITELSLLHHNHPFAVMQTQLWGAAMPPMRMP